MRRKSQILVVTDAEPKIDSEPMMGDQERFKLELQQWGSDECKVYGGTAHIVLESVTPSQLQYFIQTKQRRVSHPLRVLSGCSSIVRMQENSKQDAGLGLNVICQCRNLGLRIGLVYYG